MDFKSEIIQALPETAREKLHGLIEGREDAYAVLRAAESALEEAHRARDRAEIAYRSRVERTTYSASGQAVRLPEYEIAKLRAPVIRAEEDVERLKVRRNRAAEVWQTFDFLADLREWIGEARMAGRRFKAASPVKPVSSDFHKSVEHARRRLDEISIEAERVELAPLPIAELRAAVEAEVDALAGKGALFVDPRIRSGSPLKLEGALGVSGQGDRVSSLASSLVFLLRDQIKTSALALLPAKELPGSLSDAARKAELARLSAERLEFERAEEAAIVAASAAGITIARRRDASPLAVLEIAES